MNILRFAKYSSLLTTTEQNKTILQSHRQNSKGFLPILINAEKTKTMVTEQPEISITIRKQGEDIEQVNRFVYLWEDGNNEKATQRKIGCTSHAFGKRTGYEEEEK